MLWYVNDFDFGLATWRFVHFKDNVIDDSLSTHTDPISDFDIFLLIACFNVVLSLKMCETEVNVVMLSAALSALAAWQIPVGIGYLDVWIFVPW